jgi:hypothetical protein
MDKLTLEKTIRSITEELNGSTLDYSDNNIIATIPLSEGRFQSITTYLLENPNGSKTIEFASRVCDADTPGIDYRHCLEVNRDLVYSKVIIQDGYIQLAASILVEHATRDIIKDIIVEIAQKADDLEMELTGADMH